MVGAFKPKMLRVVAKHADWWNVSSTSLEAYHKYMQDFEVACAEVGRDPKTVRRSWCGGCVCAPTQERVATLMSERYQPGEDLVGTPQQVIEQMQSFIELGVDYFMLDCGGFPDLTTVKTLVKEVIPVINGPN
jgi:alkanesulfonate monooxygenase SsuD/methylene tetrahydromethanopterin reductase-like flavin-dependent oxidoreductase (luciferase family)